MPTESPIEDLTTRSLQLAYLARLLADPALSDPAAEAYLNLPAGAGGSLLTEILRQVRAGRRAEAYGATFGPIPAGHFSPYETSYGSSNAFTQSQALADISGFYRAFGVEPASVYRERPDHLGAELEFLGFLEFKEALALTEKNSEAAQICQSARRRFLEEHVGRWAPVLLERLSLEAAHELYRLLGALGLELLEESIASAGARCRRPESLTPPEGIAEEAYPELFNCAGGLGNEEPVF